jgi:MHS family citrate/tricarballylate:H+ symporter-like MFS transporter
MTGDRASPGFWLMCAAASGFIAAMVIYRGGAVEAREQAVAAQQA